MSGSADGFARLRGHLDVLLAFRDELYAIGASDARLQKNREDIARVRAELGLHHLGDEVRRSHRCD